MTLDSQNLATCSIASRSIDAIQPSHSLSLVAGGVLIVASNHLVVHVLGVAYSESEHNINRGVGSNGAHFTAHLSLGIDWENSIFLNKSFEVHTIAIESDLNPWKLWKIRTLLLLSLSRINLK
jgi:hypothetical protein